MQVCESVQYKCGWDGSKGRMEAGGRREEDCVEVYITVGRTRR